MLTDTYRQYIAALNDRRLDDLNGFVHERLIYNGDAITRADYRNRIANDIAAIPDLHYHISLLVSEVDRIACRIEYHCTPQREFLGQQPNGSTIDFAEHVFYRFDDGKIAQVWSVLDAQAVQQQLASGK